MPLDPALNLTGDLSVVKVSASDVSGTCECGRFLGLKTRKKVQVIDGWQRLFPQGARAPFPLGDIVDLLVEAGRHDLPTYEAQSAWLTEAIDRRGVHRLVRAYVALAVENILDAHESVGAEVGPLRLLVVNPETGTDSRRLTAWAPLYTTDDGIREIRKFRLGSVRADEESMRWASVAACVAAEYRGGPAPRRVRVIEIGAVDGSLKVLFDGTAAEARSQFVAHGRDLARAVADDDHVVACHSCGGCKAAARAEHSLASTGSSGSRAGATVRARSPQGILISTPCALRSGCLTRNCTSHTTMRAATALRAASPYTSGCGRHTPGTSRARTRTCPSQGAGLDLGRAR